LTFEPQLAERVWGGRRLRRGGSPVGEAWVAFGDSVVASGPLAGATLAELSARFGAEVAGTAVVARHGDRWPLLIKLLDCADWLSIQVHPNDEQAHRLAGPDQSGKTEAWFVLEAAPAACILLGVRPGVDAAELASAIREGRVGDVAAEVDLEAGQAVLIPAGTIHALGPGLLLYEIQQQSDITYRAYDWGRAPSAGRSLHIEESAEVAAPLGPQVPRRPAPPEGGLDVAVECSYFVLELGRAGSDPLPLATDGGSFHLLTIAGGAAEVSCGGESVRLDRLESVLVAAGAGEYLIRAIDGPATFLRASVPD
jgi:mannose-6-phosphate isomerase